MREPGYWEAVENLAWEVRKLANKEFDDLPLTGDEDIDMPLMMAKTKVSENVEDWNTLDDIFYTIAETYDVSVDEVLTEVWTIIVRQDLQERGWVS